MNCMGTKRIQETPNKGMETLGVQDTRLTVCRPMHLFMYPFLAQTISVFVCVCVYMCVCVCVYMYMCI